MTLDVQSLSHRLHGLYRSDLICIGLCKPWILVQVGINIEGLSVNSFFRAKTQGSQRRKENLGNAAALCAFASTPLRLGARSFSRNTFRASQKRTSTKLWLKFIQGQKFYISFGALDGRLDHTHDFEAENSCGAVNFLDHSRPLFRIAHDSAASNLSSTYFKLRFNERDDRAAVND